LKVARRIDEIGRGTRKVIGRISMSFPYKRAAGTSAKLDLAEQDAPKREIPFAPHHVISFFVLAVVRA